MPAAERAKQFMPFSAVRGLQAALRRKEQELSVQAPKLIADEAAAELDAKLHSLQKGSRAAITYFAAGRYIQSRGQVQAIDSVKRLLFLLTDDSSVVGIVWADIIEIDLF